MHAQAYEGEILPYVILRPENATADAAYPLVVLLHGFGASMHDLTSLGPAIDAEGYVYAFPNAPYRVNLGYGQVGYSWALGRPGVEPAPAGMPDVEAMLERAMAEIARETGAAAGRIVLGGFSQGGGLTLRYGLPRPDTFAGLSVLSGFFRDADQVRPRLPPVRAQPIFVAHGTYDQMVGGEAGRLTKAFLEDSGYAPEYHEYDMAHQIVPEEIDDLRAWLHATLAPKS
jgi:phospholipase/carboxylesterase